MKHYPRNNNYKLQKTPKIGGVVSQSRANGVNHTNRSVSKACDPVKVNTNFTIFAILEDLKKKDNCVRDQFNEFNIKLLSPSHYNITDNLLFGGINITCQSERLGEKTIKVKGKLPVLVLYNKSVCNIKKQLNRADISTLVQQNHTRQNFCTGAYKGFSKRVLADYLEMDYDDLIIAAGEDTELFDVQVCLHAIHRFKDSNKKYMLMPEYLVESCTVKLDDNIGIATVDGFKSGDDGYPLVIDGLQVEYNNYAADHTKDAALYLAKLLLDFFSTYKPGCCSFLNTTKDKCPGGVKKCPTQNL